MNNCVRNVFSSQNIKHFICLTFIARIDNRYFLVLPSQLPNAVSINVYAVGASFENISVR